VCRRAKECDKPGGRGDKRGLTGSPSGRAACTGDFGRGVNTNLSQKMIGLLDGLQGSLGGSVHLSMDWVR
jgi:hypothetical protein